MNRLSIDPRFSIGLTLLFAATLALYASAGTQPQPQAAGILIFVDSTGDGVNMGSGNVCDDGTGHCTLRAAIQLVNARNNGGDGISIGVTGTITLNSALPNLSTPVSINGPGAASLTVARNAANSGPFRIFNVTTSGTVSLSGLDMVEGRVIDDNGGGIQNYNAGTVNVTNCVLFNIGTLSDNTAIATNGGGVYNRAGGTVNITNCNFAATSAAGGNGGCIYNSSTGTINVTSTALTDSYASQDGGAVYNLGTMTVTNSTVYLFSASYGGGIYNLGTMTVTNSTLYDAQAYYNGGGIYNADFATINVINSTIYGNKAAYPPGSHPTLGGGIYNKGALNVSNSTISGNSTDTTGGGIYNDSQATGTVTVKSTIIAKNTTAGVDPDVAGSFTSQGFNLVGSRDGSSGFSAATDQTGTVASPLDPKFDLNGLQNNGGPTFTIALVSGSPAIDKGNSTTIAGVHLTADQRGVGYLRTVDDPSIPNATGGDGADIGAFEFGAHIDAASQKTHGPNPDPTKTFGIPISLTGSPLGIECRRNTSTDAQGSPNFGRDHEVVITFPIAVTVGDVSVTSNNSADTPTATFSRSSNIVTVDLHTILDARRFTITLTNVSDGTNTNDISFPMGVLAGDTNNDTRVNVGDTNQTKSLSGQPLDQNSGNFRSDVNLDGRINVGDTNFVKAHAGNSLP